MGRITGLIGIAFTCIFACSATPAVAASYRIDSWTTENGLPQNSVLSILQTRDGYLWFTTLNGLVRFNGVQFTIFDKYNTKGISSNRCNTLFEDHEGALWVGTEDGGLIRYYNGVFSSYTRKDGLPANRLFAVREDGDGLLVATINGLARLRDNKIVPESGAKVFGFRDRSGAIWYVRDGAVFRSKDGRIATTGIAGITLRALGYEVYPAVFEDQSGGVWFPTHSGIYRVKGSQTAVYQRVEPAAAEIRASCEDRRGNLWFATAGAGLLRLSDGQFTALTTTDGLPSNDLTAIYQDREGVLWGGSQDRGLFRVSPRPVEVYSQKDGLAVANVYPIFEDHSGDVWVGTWGAGVYRIRGGNLAQPPDQRFLPNEKVTAIAEDRRGRLWVGRIGGVAFIENGKATNVDFSNQIGFHTNVRAICEDREGNMWFGTQASGLVRLRNGEIRVFNSKDGLPDDQVKAILEDKQGVLWIATYGGVASYRDGKFHSLTEQQGLASNQVRSLYEDRYGVLWIGTYDGGLSRLQNGRITTYRTKDGLFNNGVFQIVEDDSGDFWMSSNLGIYRVSRRELEDFAAGKTKAISSVPFGKLDGLLNPECNGGSQPAGTRTRDGRIWFPTLEGVAVIDPRQVPHNRLAPAVRIEACTLDRTPLDCGRTIEVRHDRRNLEIQYAAITFIKPEHARFRYRMEGLDRDWVDAGSRRTAYYPYLPAGNYTFRVIAANADGVWNEEGASIGAVVVPFVWETVWFRSMVALTVVGLLLLIYEWRIRQLKRARSAREEISRRMIDSQEGERSRIAAELHDSLGQSLAIIKNRALLGMETIEDSGLTREQFDQIAEQATQAIEEAKEIAFSLRPYLLDRLGLTRAIRSMLNKVADASGISFSADLDPGVEGLLSKDKEINLYRIVQESVNNIVKHSGASEARVEIKKGTAGIEVLVEDNGAGFVAATAAGSSGNGGFGLIGIAERARLLGASPGIHSTPGHGTAIHLNIPLPQ